MQVEEQIKAYLDTIAICNDIDWHIEEVKYDGQPDEYDITVLFYECWPIRKGEKSFVEIFPRKIPAQDTDDEGIFVHFGFLPYMSIWIYREDAVVWNLTINLWEKKHKKQPKPSKG